MKSTVISISIFCYFLLFSCSTDDSNSEEAQNLIPTIISFNPKEGIAGDVITITGSNFPTNIPLNSITFSDTAGIILENSSNEIKVEVPTGLAGGSNPIKLIINDGSTNVGSFVILEDDYKYLLLDNGSNNLNLYEIGNNTGLVTRLDEIENTNFNVSVYGSVKQEEFIYINEFSSSNDNYLHVYDLANRTKNKVTLEMPTGISAGITALRWNPISQKLVAIATEDLLTTNVTRHHLLEIDPNTIEVRALGTPFEHSFISSVVIRNSAMYIFSSSAPYYFSKIDLESYDLEILSMNNAEFSLGRSAFISDTDIIGLQLMNTFNSSGNLMKLNLTNNSIESYSSSSVLINSTGLGYGFYDLTTNEYIDSYFNSSIESDDSGGLQGPYQSIIRFDVNSQNIDTLIYRPKRNFGIPTILGKVDL